MNPQRVTIHRSKMAITIERGKAEEKNIQTTRWYDAGVHRKRMPISEVIYIGGIKIALPASKSNL